MSIFTRSCLITEIIRTMSGEGKDAKKMVNGPMEGHKSRSRNRHGDTPGYAAATHSSSSKSRDKSGGSKMDRSTEGMESRSRHQRSKERTERSKERSREHKSKDRDHHSKERDKSKSRKEVAFQAHTLPARLPSSAKEFYEQAQQAEAKARRRQRQSLSADRSKVTPPWATHYPVHLNDGCFFNSIRSPRPTFFVIHPEWGSESVSKRRMNIVERPQLVMPGRRCFSAPPPRSRNPITWEYS